MKSVHLGLLAATLLSGCAVERKDLGNHVFLKKTNLLGENTSMLFQKTPEGYRTVELIYRGPFAEQIFTNLDDDEQYEHLQQKPYMIFREPWDLWRDRDGKAFASFFWRNDNKYEENKERFRRYLEREKSAQESPSNQPRYDPQPLVLDGQTTALDTK